MVRSSPGLKYRMLNQYWFVVSCLQVGFLNAAYLTPANLGPDEANAPIVPTMYTVCVIALCVMILFAYSTQVLTDHKVDAGTTSPNDFAIMVKAGHYRGFHLVHHGIARDHCIPHTRLCR